MAMQRKTVQRNHIRETFERVQRPLSPREVFENTRSQSQNLGIATVYRTVKELVQTGWLVQVSVPGESPRYEPAGKRHHHHFQCRKCRKLFELDGGCTDKLLSIATPKGFSVEGHDLLLYGHCSTCAK